VGVACVVGVEGVVPPLAVSSGGRGSGVEGRGLVPPAEVTGTPLPRPLPRVPGVPLALPLPLAGPPLPAGPPRPPAGAGVVGSMGLISTEYCCGVVCCGVGVSYSLVSPANSWQVVSERWYLI